MAKRFLIEGVTGTGKSTIYSLLMQEITRRGCLNLFTVSQYYTARVMEESPPERASQIGQEVLEQVLSTLKHYDLLANQSGLQHTSRGHLVPYQTVIEGFHIELAMRGMIDDQVFVELDQQLVELQFMLVYLKLPEKEMAERCVRSTRRYRTQGWTRYLESLGRTDFERTQVFIQRQQILDRYVRRSNLSKLVIDTSAMDWPQYVEEILTGLD